MRIRSLADLLTPEQQQTLTSAETATLGQQAIREALFSLNRGQITQIQFWNEPTTTEEEP